MEAPPELDCSWGAVCPHHHPPPRPGGPSQGFPLSRGSTPPSAGSTPLPGFHRCPGELRAGQPHPGPGALRRLPPAPSRREKETRWWTAESPSRRLPLARLGQEDAAEFARPPGPASRFGQPRASPALRLPGRAAGGARPPARPPAPAAAACSSQSRPRPWLLLLLPPLLPPALGRCRRCAPRSACGRAQHPRRAQPPCRAAPASARLLIQSQKEKMALDFIPGSDVRGAHLHAYPTGQ